MQSYVPIHIAAPRGQVYVWVCGDMNILLNNLSGLSQRVGQQCVPVIHIRIKYWVLCIVTGKYLTSKQSIGWKYLVCFHYRQLPVVTVAPLIARGEKQHRLSKQYGCMIPLPAQHAEHY